MKINLKKIWIAVGFLIFSALLNISNFKEVRAAISKYGLPGIYNAAPLTLTDNAGAALALDSQGRLILSTTTAITITGGGTGTAWTTATNYGETVFSTSTPLWFRGHIYASSTAIFVGVSTTGNIEPTVNNLYDNGKFGNAWRSLYVSSTAYFSGPILGADGSASAPTYSFDSLTNAGMTISGGSLSIITAGSVAIQPTISNTFFFIQPVPSSAGAVTLGSADRGWGDTYIDVGNKLSFDDDDNTYLVANANNALSFFSNASEVATVTTTGLTSGSNNGFDLGAYGKSFRNVFASSTAFLSNVTSTSIEPWANNTSALGAFGTAWSNVFVSGTVYTAGLTIDGNTTIGNATSDTLTVTARLAADLNPIANNTYDLGAFGLSYNNLFASSTSYLNYVSSTAIEVIGSLKIPASSDPTVLVTGELAINTTAASSSLRLYDGTEEKALYTTRPTCIVFTSTTAQTIGGLDATSTVELGTMFHPETWVYGYCYAKNGTGGVDFTDGDGNATNYMPCTTLTTSTRRTFSSNNTFTMGEAFNLRARLNTGAQQLSICVLRETDPD